MDFRDQLERTLGDAYTLERRHAHRRLAPRPCTIVEMDSTPLRIIRQQIRRAELAAVAETQFGDMVKAVVDVERNVLAIGGELHSDEEAALLDDGSRQRDLWGINLYPGETGVGWIEFDSMINVRPSQQNRSRDVEDEAVREAIRRVVSSLVRDG